MSIEENKALVSHLYELLNRQDFSAANKFIAPGYVAHYNTGDVPFEQWQQIFPSLYKAFPDAHWTIEEIIAEGDIVAIRETMRGTHKGEFMGIAPTGKKIEMKSIGMVRIKDGKWVEGWATIDNSWMQQLDVIPPMGQT